jgi:hypothetical protein
MNPMIQKELLRAALSGIQAGLDSQSAPVIPPTTENGNYAFVTTDTTYWFTPGQMSSFLNSAGFDPTTAIIPDQDLMARFKYCWDRFANRGDANTIPGVVLSS